MECRRAERPITGASQVHTLRFSKLLVTAQPSPAGRHVACCLFCCCALPESAHRRSPPVPVRIRCIATLWFAMLRTIIAQWKREMPSMSLVFLTTQCEGPHATWVRCPGAEARLDNIACDIRTAEQASWCGIEGHMRLYLHRITPAVIP